MKIHALELTPIADAQHLVTEAMALLQNPELTANQLIGGNRLLCQQRMPFGKISIKLFLKERLLQYSLFVQRRGNDAQIQLITFFGCLMMDSVTSSSTWSWTLGYFSRKFPINKCNR